MKKGEKLSEVRKKEIGDFFRGRKQSAKTIKSKSDYMEGKASRFKGKKHKPESIALIKEKNSGKNHYNWKGRTEDKTRSEYSVMLRRKKNGFTEELFYRRIKDQDNKCAICDKDFDENVFMRKKSADHCHKNKIARGVLCRKCNLMLGNSEDNIKTLKRAIEYLESWERTA